jgi:hypothetical protein
MIKIIAFIFLVLSLVSCAPMMTYTPPKIETPEKMEHYQMPPDPFEGMTAPQPIFLAKATGINLPGTYWREVPKEQAELTCYTAKEHDKIVLKLSYYKEIVPALVRLVNIHIDLNNAHIQLIVDENLAKELYKQFWIDTENKRIADSRWSSLEKGGLWAIILGQLITLAITVAK